VLEIKAVELLAPIHVPHWITCLKLSGMRVGLRMNDGINRLVPSFSLL